MNVVGKILIGLVTFMSVLFMAFALAVYASHQNWKAKATALQQQLTKERQDLKTLQDQRDRLSADIEAEKRSLGARLVTLEAEQKNLDADLVAKRKVLADTQVEQQKGMKAMQVAQETMAKTDAELKGLRQTKQDTDKQRDDELAQAVISTDQANQAANELNAVKATNKTLIQDLMKYKAGK
jgi:chromosome segregation ATPase